jgi:hypothetical protein
MRLVVAAVLIFQYIKARLTHKVVVGATVRICAKRYEPEHASSLDYYFSFSKPPSNTTNHDEMYDDYGYPDSDVYHYARSISDLVSVAWNLGDDEWDVRSGSLSTASLLGD